jgi:hypothetical protein
MDVTPYEGKKVRLTLVYEGKLTHRSLRAPEFVIKGEDGRTWFVNPDRVTDVEFSFPAWWPPLPGDVLHFGNDRPERVYTVSTDGNMLVLNNAKPFTTYKIEDIQPGQAWVQDPDQWTLLHKGTARQAKEGK